MYPNLYVFLIANPGIGKQVIERVRHLWEEIVEPQTKILALKVAPDSMTRASFIDDLSAAKQTKIPPQGSPYVYHSLLITQEEWAVLFPAYDLPFLSTLTALWGNRELHRETRRTGKVTNLLIQRPTLNILAGYQPALMATTFPEEAWAGGFTRRLVMVYSGSRPHRDLFFDAGGGEETRPALLEKLSRLTGAYGQFQWNRDAAERASEWDASGGQPAPNHPKLEHYLQSRTEMILKLSMIHAASRGALEDKEYRIHLEDVETAIKWLMEVEKAMPDIFRQMTGKSDVQILDELHYYVTALYASRKAVPIPTEDIMQFLAERAPTDRILKIYDIAEKAGYISRIPGTDGPDALWTPAPRRGPMGLQ